MMPEKVRLYPCGDYDISKLRILIDRIFTEAELGKRIKPGMKVILKPNLIMKSDPDSGIITHPLFVAAVGLAVKELGADVLIAESSGGVYTPAVMKSIFTGCGYTDIAEKYGFELYTECKSREVELKEAVLCHRVTLLEPFIDPDFVIDIPKLKSHCMMMFSGAVKNLFGTVPGLMKPELHFRFPQKPEFAKMLVDICEGIKPDFSIMDGIDALEGDGPTSGTKCHIGAVVASESPYAADDVACRLAMMKQEEILYLNEAEKRGLYELGSCEIIGAKPEELCRKDYKQPATKDVDFSKRVPGFLRPLAVKLTTPKPIVEKSKCIGCGKCAESCPRHTIDIVNKKAVINYNSCIRCFCCHEMCPKHIIKVKRFSLFNL